MISADNPSLNNVPCMRAHISKAATVQACSLAEFTTHPKDLIHSLSHISVLGPRDSVLLSAASCSSGFGLLLMQHTQSNLSMVCKEALLPLAKRNPEVFDADLDQMHTVRLGLTKPISSPVE
eukprot:2207656-Amphidinium_carterae.3